MSERGGFHRRRNECASSAGTSIRLGDDQLD
jgi:hypothetical protein